LLEKRESVLLEKEGSGCRALLANDKAEDLARMYRLFSRVPDGLAPMAAIAQQFVESRGVEVIARREAKLGSGERDPGGGDPAYVKELLALHDKYMAVVTEQFGGNSLFQKALKEAFVEVVNRDVGKMKNADLMSSFCDRILKTGGEKLNDEQVEEYLEKVVQLFSYLTDKDLFAEIYRTQLAAAAQPAVGLDDAPAADDRQAEAAVRLAVHGQDGGHDERPGHWGGPRGGLRGPPAGRGRRRGRRRRAGGNGGGGGVTAARRVGFNAGVDHGYWAHLQDAGRAPPLELVALHEVFKEYYDREDQPPGGWPGDEAECPSSPSAPVACVTRHPDPPPPPPALRPRLCPAPQERTNLPEEVLKRVLHSLSCGKFKLLRKSSEGGAIRPGDAFRYNAGFACPMRKLRVPMAALDQSHNPKRVEEDRSVAIEAAVVRIMKARKALSHQQLLAEVLSQLAFFRPSPRVIKRRVEALIDREYLSARDRAQ
ncbi:unnamed protein product, partial [Heterosigma akashiwo]